MRAISYAFHISLKRSDEQGTKIELIAARQKACYECKRAPPLYCNACVEAALAKASASNEAANTSGVDDDGADGHRK